MWLSSIHGVLRVDLDLMVLQLLQPPSVGIIGIHRHVYLFKWVVRFKFMYWCLQSKMLLPRDPSLQPLIFLFCWRFKLS